jgi:hypothetical protein
MRNFLSINLEYFNQGLLINLLIRLAHAQYSNFKYLEMSNKKTKSKQAKRDLQMNKEIKTGGV